MHFSDGVGDVFEERKEEPDVFIFGSLEVTAQFVSLGLKGYFGPEVRFVPSIRALGVLASFQNFSAYLRCFRWAD